MSVPADFTALYDFPLDPFQNRACEAVAAGRGVLVAAPTGSGKTVVGEFAVHQALASESKCFYTTPIKALSNQKFADLTRRYGAGSVGLLTGDRTVNGEAPVVVMTTEVLRNMLYAGSATLSGLRYVVMDEVHYLADRSRGAVWEEAIIHLPGSVSVIALSATVSNAEEFGDWLRTVRGDTDIVLEERRPVPLYQHVLVGTRLYDLFAESAAGRAEVSPDAVSAVRQAVRASRVYSTRGQRRPPRSRAPAGVTPRPEMVVTLDRAGLLPCIVFIFSRLGCDAAVTQCTNAQLRFTSREERTEIISVAVGRLAALSDADLAVLDYNHWLESLSRGIAVHHAGLLPAFKECVEELFVRGLIKVVFATETLALGINMPARSVVLEKLSKWNGEHHADVTPGEYTQLTGRAGRRGIDVEGHAVVVWRPEVELAGVAGLASTRTYRLRSSFRPSYNMAVNVVGQVGTKAARELLESSFAQFQTDRAVVGLAQRVRQAEEAAGRFASQVECDRGDFDEYTALVRALAERESSAKKQHRIMRRADVAAALRGLQAGDVIDVPLGRWAGRAVVVERAAKSSSEDPRPLVVTAERQARRLSFLDFDQPVEPVTRIRVPKTFNPRNPQQRRSLAAQLRFRTRDAAPDDSRRSKPKRDPETERLRRAVRMHPCHRCSARDDHTRWAERYLSARREAAELTIRIEQRTNTIARQFDRVCDLLTELGYLAQGGVTATGRSLARLYNELDLVAAEALRRGVWKGLTAAELAACLSALVYETRRVEGVPATRPQSAVVRSVLAEMQRIQRDLQRVERRHQLDFLRELDTGFADAAYLWASGVALATVLDEIDITPGDFVRSVKQLLDLCEQVADAAGDGGLRGVARQAVRGLRRGVVAYAADSD